MSEVLLVMTPSTSLSLVSTTVRGIRNDTIFIGGHTVAGAGLEYRFLRRRRNRQS